MDNNKQGETWKEATVRSSTESMLVAGRNFLCGMPVESPVGVLYYCRIFAARTDADGFSR